jgi:hypothetical protein
VAERVFAYCFVQAIQRVLKVVSFEDHGTVFLRDQFDFVFAHGGRLLCHLDYPRYAAEMAGTLIWLKIDLVAAYATANVQRS